jgi:myo-inositol 2-dehydrogenase/D-chiro-inositol 1-dehydrogenase
MTTAGGRARRGIGLAVVGCGKIGRIRAEFAGKTPAVEWLGVCDIDEKVGRKLAEDVSADFFTKDYRELLRRPEVNASVIATFASEREGPVLAGIARGHRMLIEKPLATGATESATLARAIAEAGVDAVLGYTQRFRRRFIAAKERIQSGALGEVTSVTARAFLSRLNPIANSRKAEDPTTLTPMVISGTHAADLCLWFLEGKRPVEVYARSVAKALAPYHTQDSTFALVTFEDGTIWSINVSWAMPAVWPAEVYSMELGVVGTEGVLTIDDTHRDLVLATERPHTTHRPGEGKHVSFLGSYPPGDVWFRQLWGPMREETKAWFDRIYLDEPTPHTTAAEGHDNLMLCLAMDRSAHKGVAIHLPIEPKDLEALR